MNRHFGRSRSRPPRYRHHRRAISGALTPTPENDWHLFEASLVDLETAVQSLRSRYEQTRAIQHRQQQLEQELQTADLSPQAVNHLQQQLNELEAQLESSLFDWGAFSEPFWQAVRFGGVGIIIGWVLNGLASR